MPPKAAKQKNQSWIVGSLELAKILGITDKRIRQLAEIGILERLKDAEGNVLDGKWDLPASVKAYVKYKVDSVTSTENEVALEEAKLRKMRAEAEAKELAIEIARGDVHRAEDVRAVLEDCHSNAKAKLLALPSKTARLLVGQSDIAAIFEILNKAVLEAANEIRSYRASDFHARNAKYLLELEDDQTEQPETDSETESGKVR